MIDAVVRALGMAVAMGWEIFWPLMLGFALSAVVQAAVSKQQMSRLLPDDRPRSIATALGAASSSCCYAAVALARSIFRKGAHFAAAMAFEMASTNLVLELGLIVLVLLGWQFTLAEFLGSPLMVLLFRMFLGRDLLEQVKEQADKGIAGRMEGHAERDMSVAGGGSLWQRMTSDRGLARQAQRFLSAHDQINNLFYFRRDHVTAAEHRASRTQKFQIWAEILWHRFAMKPMPTAYHPHPTNPT